MSVHNIEVMDDAHALENTCQKTSVAPETNVADRITELPGATNENHTSSSGEPELVVQAPVGVTFEFVALAVD